MHKLHGCLAMLGLTQIADDTSKHMKQAGGVLEVASVANFRHDA